MGVILTIAIVPLLVIFIPQRYMKLYLPAITLLAIASAHFSSSDAAGNAYATAMAVGIVVGSCIVAGIKAIILHFIK